MQASDVYAALLFEFQTPFVSALELGCRLTGLGERQFKSKLKKNQFTPSFQKLFASELVDLEVLAEEILQRRGEVSYD